MTDMHYENFSQLLRTTIPGFEKVYDEHVADYDEVLPHVLLGDLVRFLSSEVGSKGQESLALQRAMVLLEQAMGSSDARLQELVAVSFLENLDATDPGFSAIRTLFGPKLERQYRKYEVGPK